MLHFKEVIKNARWSYGFAFNRHSGHLARLLQQHQPSCPAQVSGGLRAFLRVLYPLRIGGDLDAGALLLRAASRKLRPSQPPLHASLISA
jgi:hypothetical protein